MEVLRARNIRRLMLWRGLHYRRSLLARERVKDQNSSFTESLLTHELSDRRWCKPHSEKVPRGCLPVYVGPEERRFIIPMVCLSMPEFRKLMESTADEFGFEQEGGLKLPCDEDDFEDILFNCLAKHRAASKTRRN